MMTHFIQAFFDMLTSPIFAYVLGFGGCLSLFILSFSIFCARGDISDI